MRTRESAAASAMAVATAVLLVLNSFDRICFLLMRLLLAARLFPDPTPLDTKNVRSYGRVVVGLLTRHSVITAPFALVQRND